MQNITKPPIGSLLQSQHLLTKELTGYWLMDEGVGSRVNDVSGYGNTGTITNAVWSGGKFGHALSFDGAGDVVSCGNTNKVLTSFTLSAWVNLRATFGSGWRTVVGRWSDTAIQRQFVLCFGSGANGYLVGFIQNAAGNTKQVNGTTPQASFVGAWNHVAMVFNAPAHACTLHVNGRLEGTVDTVSTSLFDYNNNFKIGDHDSATACWDGLISHVTFWRRALTVPELGMLAADPFVMFRRSRIELWTAASPSGVTIIVPGTASVTVTAFVPTVATTANASIVPGTGSLTVTGFVPTIDKTVHFFGIPGTANIAVTGYVPGVEVTYNALVIPGTGSVVLTSYVPTVAMSNNITVVPGTASVVVTSYVPDIAVSTNADLVPGTAAVVITSYAPTVTVAGDFPVVPGTAAVTLTCYAPSVVRVTQRHNVKGFETSDGVVLTWGSIGDGQYLKRVGNVIVGVS